ncbi:MAG: hypothetical protein QXP27_05090, partial [Candidatus Methanomethyliaceae archaeon]
METTRNWDWVVDEIERSGCTLSLAHAAKIKLMSGVLNKTDKLDGRGSEKFGAEPSLCCASG